MSDYPTWEIGLLVSCSKEEAEELAEEVLNLASGRGWGAVVSASRPADRDQRLEPVAER